MEDRYTNTEADAGRFEDHRAGRRSFNELMVEAEYARWGSCPRMDEYGSCEEHAVHEPGGEGWQFDTHLEGDNA
jgi:hypothetical protein